MARRATGRRGGDHKLDYLFNLHIFNNFDHLLDFYRNFFDNLDFDYLLNLNRHFFDNLDLDYFLNRHLFNDFDHLLNRNFFDNLDLDYLLNLHNLRLRGIATACDGGCERCNQRRDHQKQGIALHSSFILSFE